MVHPARGRKYAGRAVASIHFRPACVRHHRGRAERFLHLHLERLHYARVISPSPGPARRKPGISVTPEAVLEYPEAARALNGSCLIAPNVMLVADSVASLI